MKVIRREAFDYRGKRYEIVVENLGAQLRATVLRNGRNVKRTEVLGGLDEATSYDSIAGMKMVDSLIGLVQNKLRLGAPSTLR
jgi:hypothetical protein